MMVRGLLPSTKQEVANAATRLLLGAALGCIPFLITCLMAPEHRSPYVVAYPAVILSAWLWETAGAVGAALAAGSLIEHFVFATHRINLAPTSAGMGFREITFLFGSILAGALTRIAANQREAQARVAAEHQLALARAQQQVLEERERLNDLSREDEIRTELALEGAGLGTWEWNVITNQSRWSPGFYRLHRLSPDQPANYELWRSLVHPDDIARTEAEIRAAMAARVEFTSEYRVRANGNDQEERWVVIGGKLVTSDDSGPTTMAGYCLDVTRRKRHEAALIQTEKLAVAGRLAASIAHEINNPLEAATNLVYLSRDSSADPATAAYLDEALVQLERVATIANQTLRFSKRSGGASTCRPSEVVRAVMNLLGPKLTAAGVEIDVDVRADVQVPCHHGELQQIVTNLVNNAADAMPQDGKLRIRITRSLFWSRNGQPGLRVTISDNGLGMTPEVQRRSREPFFTTKSENGTGLGLWVTHELVGRYNGNLSVRSRTSSTRRGTTFSLLLPFAETPQLKEA